jgi:HSP20 family protein
MKMTNLKVYDPFSTEPFDDVFSGFFRPARYGTQVTEPQIKIDVEETDAAYKVRAEIPGVKKEDINVEVDGDIVSIRAEVKNEKDVKQNGKILRSERFYGAMTRRFSLERDVDEAHTAAKYENGVLFLELPKKAASSSKRVAIG